MPIDLDKFRSIDIQQRKILREIAEELGQLSQRVGKVEMEVKNPLTSCDVLAIDADEKIHAVQNNQQ